MPTPSTYQTLGMKVYDGLAPNVDSNGFIADIAFKFKVQAKTANYTVKATESGGVFTTYGATAAVTFTLPAVADGNGCVFFFFSAADQNMIVASAAGDDIVTKNDLAADSVAFQTTSEKIGGGFMIVGTGTVWLAFVLAEELMTVTVAT